MTQSTVDEFEKVRLRRGGGDRGASSKGGVLTEALTRSKTIHLSLSPLLLAPYLPTKGGGDHPGEILRRLRQQRREREPVADGGGRALLLHRPAAGARGRRRGGGGVLGVVL